EVAADDRSAAGPRCLDLVVDRPVVAVAELGRRFGRIALAVAREAELLERQWLAHLVRQPFVRREVVADLRAARVPGPREVLPVDPAPVERPDMRGQVVDVG